MADLRADGDNSIMDWFSSAFGEFPCLLHSRKARELNSIRVQIVSGLIDDTTDDEEVDTSQDNSESDDDTKINQGEAGTIQDSPKSDDDIKREEQVYTIKESPKCNDVINGDKKDVHIIQDSPRSKEETTGNQGEVHAIKDSSKSNDDTKGNQGEVHAIKDSPKSNDDTKGNQGEVHAIKDSSKSNDDTKGNQGEVHAIKDSSKSIDDTKGNQGEVHAIKDSPKSNDDTKENQGEVHAIKDSPKSNDETKGNQGEVHAIKDSPKSNDDTKGNQGEVHAIKDSPKSNDETMVDGAGTNKNFINISDLFSVSDAIETNFRVYALLALKDENAGREACLAVQKHPFSIVARVNFAYFSCINNDKSTAEIQLAWLMDLKIENTEFFSKLHEDATYELVYCYDYLGLDMRQETIVSAEEAMQKYPSRSFFKLIYALSLRRSLNPTYMSMHPEMDFAQALQRAVEVFVELMEDVKVGQRIRAMACAELGEIINLQYDTELDDAMKRIKQNLRYTASDCYELALELGMDEQGALWRAGKYFRNVTKEYDKSYKVLKRALILFPSSLIYHQLGLTLKKLAISAKYYNKQYPGLLTYDPFPEKCKPEVNQGHIKQSETHTSSDDVSKNSKVLGEEIKQNVQDPAVSARKKDDLELKSAKDDAEKVPEINLRPCRGTLLPVCAQPAPQSGTTVMSSISIKRDIPDRVKLGWMWKSPLDSKTFSRVDRYVMETMEHFQKAVEVSLGENTPAIYDLALMHKALGEYTEALDTLQEILNKNRDLSDFVNAFEQSGLLLLEMSTTAEREKEDDFIQTGKVMLLMAVICQSRVVNRNREFRNYNKEIWRDFFNLDLYIERIKRGNKFSDKVNAQEDWLIELIRRHSGGLQVLKDILNFTIMEASSVQSMESKIRRYVHEGRYEDAMTFLALLKLTSHGQAVSSFRDADISFKVYVHAAKTRFLHVCKNKDTLEDVANSNMQVARWIFRWAFENKFEDNTLKIPSRSADTSQAFPANNVSQDHHSNDVTDDEHVILLYDPEDEAGTDCVTALHNLLDSAFGLKIKRVTDYWLSHSPSATSLILARSSLLLVVLASKEVSTKFNDYMNAAVNATKPANSVAETLSVVRSHGNILTLLTEDASLPPLLKEHRVLPYPQELQKFEVDMLKSREYVVTICKFFCQLLNSDVEIT